MQLSKWAEAQRWRNISRRKWGWERRRQVICLAGKAESGSNVHLFWQTETTGPTHSGAGPSAEIRVKNVRWRRVQECVLTVCVCVRERALPQVSKAWIKSFSSFHHTSVFIYFFSETGDRYWLIKAFAPLSTLSWVAAENKKKLTDCGGIAVRGVIREIGYFSFYLQHLSFTQTWRNEYEKEQGWTELYEPHQEETVDACFWGSLVCTKNMVHSRLIKWDFKHTPF